MWQNFLLGVDLSRYSNSTFLKTTFWIGLSRCEMAVATSWMFVRWNKFRVSPLDWIVDKLNMQKGSINVLMFLVYRFSNWIFCKAICLNSFNKIFMQMFLVKFGLGVNWFVFCSTNFLSATLTENVAVRLRPLFSCFQFPIHISFFCHQTWLSGLVSELFLRYKLSNTNCLWFLHPMQFLT